MDQIEVMGKVFTITRNIDGSYDYETADGRGFTSMSSYEPPAGRSEAFHRQAITTYIRTVTDD